MIATLLLQALTWMILALSATCAVASLIYVGRDDLYGRHQCAYWLVRAFCLVVVDLILFTVERL